MAAGVKKGAESACIYLHNVAQMSYSTEVDELHASERLTWYLNNIPDAINNINKPSSSGFTALQAAARVGNWSVACALLDAAARADLPDPDGFTVLHLLACVPQELLTEETKLGVLDLIMKQGVDLDQTDPSGNTAVHLAAWHHNWDLVKQLIWNGATAVKPDSKGYTLFHRLATASVKEFASCRRMEKDAVEELTNLLLECGLDLNSRLGGHKEQATPLHIAARREDWSVVEVFLLHGADPACLSPNGHSLLHTVAKCFKFKGGNTPTVLMRLLTLILNAGADMNSLDREGNNALHISLQPTRFKGAVHHQSISWFLLAFGARLCSDKLSDAIIREVVHSVPFAPRNILSRNKLIETINELGRGYSASTQSFNSLLTGAFDKALKTMNYQVALVLLECGAQVSQDLLGCLVYDACRCTHFSCDFQAFLFNLLERGANPDIPMVEKHTSYRIKNYTPLHVFITTVQHRLAISSDNRDVSDVVNLLSKFIAYGADPLKPAKPHSNLRTLVGICWPKQSSSSILLPILRVLVEAGVSTHQPALTALGNQCTFRKDKANLQCQTRRWGHHGQCHHISLPTAHHSTSSPLQMTLNLEVVEILIRSGACSNQELFVWKQFIQHLPPPNQSSDTHALLKVLESYTSTVPSLASLARLAVSHAIGCGSQRRLFLESRTVPERVKRFVQFEDLFVLKATRL